MPTTRYRDGRTLITLTTEGRHSDVLPPERRLVAFVRGEGEQVLEGATGIAVPQPRWRDGYHDEQIGVERAWADALGAAAAAGARNLQLEPLDPAAAGFPDEPLVFILFHTVRRYLREQPAHPFETITIAAPAAATDVYQRVFDEFVRTMVGTP
jgi:hypothetical protein